METLLILFHVAMLGSCPYALCAAWRLLRLARCAVIVRQREQEEGMEEPPAFPSLTGALTAGTCCAMYLGLHNGFTAALYFLARWRP